MHRHLLLGIIALAAGTVSAGAQGAASKRNCTPAVIDTVRYGSVPINRDCDVEKPAKLKHDEEPSYRLPKDVQCVVVEMLFVVDSTGKVVTGSASVVTTNDPEYAELMVTSLPKWRYEPARKDKKPVAQLVWTRNPRAATSFSVGRLTDASERSRIDMPPPAQTPAPCK